MRPNNVTVGRRHPVASSKNSWQARQPQAGCKGGGQHHRPRTGLAFSNTPRSPAPSAGKLKAPLALGATYPAHWLPQVVGSSCARQRGGRRLAVQSPAKSPVEGGQARQRRSLGRFEPTDDGPQQEKAITRGRSST